MSLKKASLGLNNWNQNLKYQEIISKKEMEFQRELRAQGNSHL